MSEHLTRTAGDDNVTVANKRVFWDLVKRFRVLIDNPSSDYKQLAVAVRGYSYFAAVSIELAIA